MLLLLSIPLGGVAVDDFLDEGLLPILPTNQSSSSFIVNYYLNTMLGQIGSVFQMVWASP